MDITTRREDHATVVALKGAVDLYSSPQARTTILDSIKDSKTKLVMVNLGEVTYIDSSGVATLVEGLQLSKTQNCKFVLVGLSPAAREVFVLARLDKVFSIFPSERDVLESL